MNKNLVILPSIPLKDTNAGDYRIFHLIRTLLKKSFLYICPIKDLPIPENYPYQIKDDNLKIISPEELPHILKKESISNIIFEHFFTFQWYKNQFRIPEDARVIIDSHSLKFIENERNPAIAKKEKESLKSMELNAYRGADIVIAVTEKEKEDIERLTGIRAFSVPTGIRVPDKVRGFSNRRDAVFIGCMKNIQNIDAMEYFVRDILPLLKRLVPEFKLLIAGSFPPEKIKSMKGRNIEVMGYVYDTSVYAASSVISIAPMRIGSGLKHKVVESIAYGAPVVGTEVAFEGMGLIPDKEILRADTPEDFAAKIALIYRGGELWERLSDSAHLRAASDYSMEVMERKIEELF